MAEITIETEAGPARAHLHAVSEPAGALVLGHGAGGTVEAPDLVAATGAAHDAGFSVALVEQPYRVAGKRSSPAPSRLDAVWTTVLERLADDELAGLPTVAGGRSAGARVACRTAAATAAIGVLCLAFPLQPPRRKSGAQSESRLPELDAVEVPTLIVQGEGDRFGIPPEGERRDVVLVRGDHSLRSDPEAVAAAVRDWLPSLVGTGVRR